MKYVVLLAALTLVGCFEDRFRYPCQAPANWHKAQCNPPLCKADETCTEYLIEVNR